MSMISFERRFKWTLFVVLFNAFFYFLSGNIQILPMVPVEPNWIDQSIPYLSWTCIIYVSYYLVLVLPLMLCEYEKMFFSMARASLAITIIYVGIFLFLPVRFAWEHEKHKDIFTTYVMLPIRQADNNGTNAFPSEHVAFGFIGGFVFLKYAQYKKGIFFLIWGILIAISTLTTKQHYFIDVMVSIFIVSALTLVLPGKKELFGENAPPPKN